MGLLSRLKFPPGGFQFTQPQTNWKARGLVGFENVVMQVYQHRRANPQICQAFNLSTDMNIIRNEVDAFNCARLGYDPAWCKPDPAHPPDPKSLRPHRPRAGAAAVEKVRQIAGAVSLLVDWLGSGGVTVPLEQAEKRAAICVACPLNHKGNLDAIFTQPVAMALRKTVEMRNQMKLQTSLDHRLLMCQGCSCVLKLKVWVPLDYILSEMAPEFLEKLDPNCWVTNGG